jgi:cell division protein FtsI (penicillin-binding protein 3)
MRHLKPDDYYTRLQEVGLDSKTGIDLPGEVASYLKPREEFVSQPIELATTSFGQGLSLTPVKLLQLNAALANGGRLVTPHVVRGLVDAGGTLHWKPNHPEKNIFTPQDAYRVVQMMENVVTQGTAKTAQIKGYRIGGKTGTAEKAGPRGGYSATAKITSFIAILPVEKPRYVVLAVVDEPQGGNTYGGTVAAPIVKKVMEALIAIKGIPPSSAAALNNLDPVSDDKTKPQ